MKKEGKGNDQRGSIRMREKGGYNKATLDITKKIRKVQKLGVHFFKKEGFKTVG